MNLAIWKKSVIPSFLFSLLILGNAGQVWAQNIKANKKQKQIPIEEIIDQGHASSPALVDPQTCATHLRKMASGGHKLGGLAGVFTLGLTYLNGSSPEQHILARQKNKMAHLIESAILLSSQEKLQALQNQGDDFYKKTLADANGTIQHFLQKHILKKIAFAGINEEQVINRILKGVQAGVVCQYHPKNGNLQKHMFVLNRRAFANIIFPGGIPATLQDMQLKYGIPNFKKFFPGTFSKNVKKQNIVIDNSSRHLVKENISKQDSDYVELDESESNNPGSKTNNI